MTNILHDRKLEYLSARAPKTTHMYISAGGLRLRRLRVLTGEGRHREYCYKEGFVIHRISC